MKTIRRFTTGVKPFGEIPGPKSLPLVGTLWSYLPYIGKFRNQPNIHDILNFKVFTSSIGFTETGSKNWNSMDQSLKKKLCLENQSSGFFDQRTSKNFSKKKEGFHEDAVTSQSNTFGLTNQIFTIQVVYYQRKFHGEKRLLIFFFLAETEKSGGAYAATSKKSWAPPEALKLSSLK